MGEDTPVDPKPAVNTISGTPIIKGMAVGKTALNFSWNKVEGADGYDIFFSKCNGKSKKSTYRNVRTIEGNDTFTWTRSKPR
ncbi:MAG: hypothetical protein IJI20_07360 [Firmicutes bacterium]|nr:hypothetical protein [Bacillota bacterium]